MWSRSALVKAPALWPKSWLSINSCGMAAQLTLSMGRLARGLALCKARATSSLPEPLSPRTSTEPVARARRLILDFSSCMAGALADEFAVGGFIDQALILGGQRGLLVGANQGHDQDVGQRDGEFEIGLAEAALIEIGVNGAHRVAVADERHAQGIGVVGQAFGLGGAAALLGDPHGVALAADQFGERIAEM